MKTKKLFAFAMAAMTFAACSNDDAPATGGNGEGELVESMSVYFTDPGKTYAYDSAIDGVGTENNLYEVYIFAKENSPAHAGALAGDWTVKKVGDGTTAIGKGNEGTEGTRDNMATFNGVRQGDYVYVIANDPNMNQAAAEKLAHQGKDSEGAILGHISTLSKEYLNGLAVKGDADKTQTGHFIMAGKAVIPTNPNQPNNSTIRVPVSLDREVAKVTLSATVTSDLQYEAYKKVKIEAGDGLIVARIARPVSCFADQERDWYFPLDGDKDTKDWGYSDTGADEWKVAFDGMTNSKPNTASTDFFNKTAKKDAREYRYAWDTTSSLITHTAPDATDPVDGGKIASPIFYVTPNYSKNAACVTVAVIQATYKGGNALIRDITPAIVKDALENKIFGDDVTEVTDTFWDTDANVEALHTFLTTNYADLFPAETYTDKEMLIGYKTGEKLYYRVDIANYSDDSTTSNCMTERNMFYQTQATITTLGAKSIDEAIDSDNLNMIVQVKVNPWSVSVNRVNV